jgi:hypothetical protein
MDADLPHVDARGLVLGAGAYLGLVEELMRVRTYAEVNTVCLALLLQIDHMQNEVIRVRSESERARDEGGLGGGLLG